MTHDVTSWFQQQAELKNSSPVRKFGMTIPTNIIVDGTFDTDCGSWWDCGSFSLWDISSGMARVIPGDVTDILSQYVSSDDLISGDTVQVTYTTSNVAAGSGIRLYVGNTFGSYRTVNGVYIESLIHTGPIRIGFKSQGGGSGVVDDVSAVVVTRNYSNRVLSWPSFNIGWDQVRPVRVTMQLANEDQALNFIREDKTNLQNSCHLQMGFTHPTSGAELISIFKGTIDKISMGEGTMRMILVDKFQQLAQRIIGTSDVPVAYTGSAYLVSDLAWWVCTSHGGLSAIESSNNPDIDWDTFATWAGVMSGDTVVMNARYTGTRVLEALRKIARVTNTAIYQEEDRIRFHRFSVADSHSTTLLEENIKKTSIAIDAKNIINRKFVTLDYDVTSRFHKATIVQEDSASVNSYGLHMGIEKDASLWYVNSQSAINFAQRELFIKKVPYDELVTQVPLVGMLRSVGEMIYVTDGNIGISDEPYRIMERSFSMETGQVTFNGNASQVFSSSFTLDTSSLDGADILS